MSLLSEISNRDMELFREYLDTEVRISSPTCDIKLVADFTEYNPLHNGHYHCMKVARANVNDAFCSYRSGAF